VRMIVIKGAVSALMRSFITICALFLLFPLLLIGCFKTEEPRSNINSLQEDTPSVPLSMWILSNNPKQYQDLLKVLQPYLDLNPHISLEITVKPWVSAWSDILKAVADGEGPDILQLGTTWVPAIAAMNGIEDITELVDDIGGASAFIPASWQTTMIEGKPSVYAVPWFVDARALYYRTDAFEQAGIDPKQAFLTWESFREALRQVNGTVIDGTSMSALAVPGKNDWNVAHNFFPWIWAAGGEVLTPNHKSASFNSEAAVEAVMYFTGLVEEGLASRESLNLNNNQIESEFAAGKSAVILSGPWMAAALEAPDETGGYSHTTAAKHYAIATLPAGPKMKATFVGGSNLTVFKHSQYKQEAWNMIRYLSEDEAQLAYAQITGFLPAKLDAFHAEEIQHDPNMEAFKEAMMHGKSYPSIPQWGATETALVKHFSRIWDLITDHEYERAKVLEVLDQAVAEVDQLIQP